METRIENLHRSEARERSANSRLNNFSAPAFLYRSLALSALLLTGCKTEDQPKQTAAVSEKAEVKKTVSREPLKPEEERMTEERMRDLCDRGFDLVMKDVPDDFSSTENIHLSNLSAIKGFRKKFVRWASLVNANFISLEPGIKGGGWMVVLPPNRPEHETKGPIFRLETNHPSLTPLFIKPVPMTEEWTGIGLTHEMSHFYDLLSGREQKGASGEAFYLGEARAYEVEKALVDHLSKGKYAATVKQIVEENHLYTTEDLYRYFKANGTKKLDALVNAQPPASKNEDGLRGAFHFMASALAIAEKQGRDKEEVMKLFASMIQEVMERESPTPGR